MGGWMDGSVDGWMGEWMDGWVCGQRGEKEEGKLVHKVLPAEMMITVVLMAVTTTGWGNADDVRRQQEASQCIYSPYRVPGAVPGPSMGPLI